MSLIPDDMLSIIIIAIVLTVLSYVTVLAIRTNKRIFTFLNKESSAIKDHPQDSALLKELHYKFGEMKEKMENDVNLETFLEEFMASYKVVNTKKPIVQELKLIQLSSSITILIGVLGTFIGLVVSLQGIEETLSDQSITSVLDGIHTAFYTSILGILASIAINVAATRFYYSQDLLQKVMLQLENYLSREDKKTVSLRLIDSMDEVKNAVENMTQSFIQLQNFSSHFEKATSNLNEFNEMFSTNTQTLSRLFGNMEEQTSRYNEQMAGINDRFDGLLAFLEDQNSIQTASVDTMKTTADQLMDFFAYQNDIQEQNRVSMQELAASMSGAENLLASYFDEQLEKQNDSFEAMTEFYNETMVSQREMLSVQKAVEEKNENYIRNVEQATTTMKDILETSSFDNIAEITKTFSANMNDMFGQFQLLIDYFGTIDQTQAEYRSFYEQVVDYTNQQEESQQQYHEQFTIYMENFNENSKEMNDVLSQTKAYQKAFIANNEALTEEMANLINHSQGMLSDSKAQMNEQQEKLGSTLNEFVTLTTTSMETLVTKLDDNLGGKMERSLEAFRIHVEMTNKILDKKMASLVEANSIHHEFESFNLQRLQQSLSDLEARIGQLTDGLDKLQTEKMMA
ncbi:MotA/TolQ/ExbB proton channel family protein [Bacillus marinisedimentorum]|uniref:MotA/TolQ/ExbB proton channel family protein n=1 Tax=Bacillus marinisedimentorum TaxID=1821260 RepID=UPI0007E1B8EA|nr:MotA/TolQ/ExbB proton channel family protein [Bacillus marinisedimentorum]